MSPSAFAAEGDITAVKTQSEGNNLEHDTVLGEYNSLVQVDSDTYALAYAGTDNDGFISTFTISSDGTTITELATLEHAVNNGQHNSLVQVDSDTYALAYAGNDNDGWINTFTIPADGSSITKVTQLEHAVNNGQYNSMVQVDSDTYAVAFTGNNNDGWISTFTIPADGSSITKVTNLEHDKVNAIYNSMVQVDSDTYALAYTGPADDGWISTFTIPADGSSITEVDTLEHDTVRGTHNSLVQVDSDTYALAYASTNVDGFISTFTIDSDGNITAVKTQSEGNNLEHDTNHGGYNSLIQVDSDTYALAYQGDATDGFISTFTIDSDGNITAVKTQSEGNNLEHDTDSGRYNSLIHVDSDTYALAYSGSGGDGFISTFTISAADATSSSTSSTPSTTSSSGGGCGFDRDCTPPRITHHGHSVTPDGFSINDNIFEENQERYNENHTITATVFEPVNIILRVWENMGVDKITVVNAYLGMFEETPDWKDARARIEISVQQDEIQVYDKENIFAEVNITSEKVTDPYNDNKSLDLLDVTLSIIFAKTMEPSHIGIQTIDYMTNYDMVYFEKALMVLPTENTISQQVPEWVKNTAGWWAEDKISEGEFVDGIEFLINEQIVDNVQTDSVISKSSDVPTWVKNTAGWWAEDKISEGEFVKGIEYLVKTGIIQVI